MLRGLKLLLLVGIGEKPAFHQDAGVGDLLHEIDPGGFLWAALAAQGLVQNLPVAGHQRNRQTAPFPLRRLRARKRKKAAATKEESTTPVFS